MIQAATWINRQRHLVPFQQSEQSSREVEPSHPAFFRRCQLQWQPGLHPALTKPAGILAMLRLR